MTDAKCPHCGGELPETGLFRTRAHLTDIHGGPVGEPVFGIGHMARILLTGESDSDSEPPAPPA